MESFVKKKIAIATFHSAHNYGAVLQTYALYKTIQNLGYDTFLIDYSPASIRRGYSLLPKLNDCDGFMRYIKSWGNFLLDFKRKSNRYKAFDSFISLQFQKINKDNEFSYIDEVDTIIVGSDQIWNPTITNGMDANFFGLNDFVKASKVFSYAASMGVARLNGKDEANFISLLTNLHSIGVREEILKNYIFELTSRQVHVNVDPTLLLDKDAWGLIASKAKKEKNYLLVYEVCEHEKTFSTATRIAKLLGLDIVVLSAKTNYKISSKFETDKSPEEFLSLFYHASFVVTTSFHGTVFSIINEKNFYTLKFNSDIDLRSKFLMSEVGLSDRMINKLPEDFQSKVNIDYSSRDVMNKMEYLRSKSLAYISDSLKDQ